MFFYRTIIMKKKEMIKITNDIKKRPWSTLKALIVVLHFKTICDDKNFLIINFMI